MTCRFLGAAARLLAAAQPERRLALEQRRSLAGSLLRAVPGCHLALIAARRRAAGGPLHGLPAAMLSLDPAMAQTAAEQGLRDSAIACEQLTGCPCSPACRSPRRPTAT